MIARYQNETCDCTHSDSWPSDPRLRFKVEQKKLEEGKKVEFGSPELKESIKNLLCHIIENK